MADREPAILVDPHSPDGCIIPPRSESFVEIPGVPESITRKAYMELVESWGFKLENLRALRLAFDGVYAEVYATDSDGRKLVDVPNETFVVHDVFVPINDDVPPAGQPVVWEDETYVPFKRDGDEPSQ